MLPSIKFGSSSRSLVLLSCFGKGISAKLCFFKHGSVWKRRNLFRPVSPFPAAQLTSATIQHLKWCLKITPEWPLNGRCHPKRGEGAAAPTACQPSSSLVHKLETTIFKVLIYLKFLNWDVAGTKEGVPQCSVVSRLCAQGFLQFKLAKFILAGLFSARIKKAFCSRWGVIECSWKIVWRDIKNFWPVSE